MPKQKTHSGAKKRFKITGSKKVKRMGTNMRHNLEHKTTHKKRELSRDKQVSKSDMKQVKKLLNI
jgi:large subunit ribosomal protein L35